MTYLDMAKAAVAAIKDRKGASNAAIKNHIIRENPALNYQQHHLRAALKRGVETGVLVQEGVRYKLAAGQREAMQKKRKPAVKKAAPKKKAKKAGSKPAKKTKKSKGKKKASKKSRK